MNREIKFRAWDNNSEVMIVPFHLHDIVAKNMLIVPGDILMQYTGLKDRDGKEIYEGDILEIGDKHVYICWDDEHAKFVNVEVQLGAEFAVDRSQPPKDVQNESIVIGNIYEDKELLNG